jgi:hypothetical protein
MESYKSVSVHTSCSLLCQIEAVESSVVILTTKWYIWWIRRQKIYGEPIQTLVQLVTSVKVCVANFVRATDLKHKKGW